MHDQTMIERIGAAIQAAWNSADDQADRGLDLPPIDMTPHERTYLARAVLTAMREPTEDMEVVAVEHYHRALAEESHVKARDFAAMFTAMIDAALEDGR